MLTNEVPSSEKVQVVLSGDLPDVPARKSRPASSRKKRVQSITPTKAPVDPPQLVADNPQLVSYILNLSFKLEEMKRKARTQRTKFLEVLSSLVHFFDHKNLKIAEFRSCSSLSSP